MSHEHTYVLGKFTDNIEDRPSTLYDQATSDYKWQGVAVFICDCGEYKIVTYEDNAS